MIAFSLGHAEMSGQDCKAWYPIKKGAVREMKSYDKKDKYTGAVKQRIVDVETVPNGITIIVDAEIYDEKDKMLMVNDQKMSCMNGVFTMDMKNFIDQTIWAGMTGLEVKINASDMEFPATLTEGQDLKDASIDVQAINMGIPMIKMNVKIYDRKVEAREDITTPAGTFTCYRVSYTTEVQSFGKYTARGIDWYAEDVGTVRSESYDKNGKLSSYSILTMISQ